MLFIDSSNPEEIRQLWKWGAFRGVTTNPIIWRKDGGGDIRSRLREILNVSEGDVSVQLTTPLEREEDVGVLLDEAESYADIDKRIVIKTVTGGPLEMYAIGQLVCGGFRVNVTCCMNAAQAELAVCARVTYVSLFWNRMKDFGACEEDEVRQTKDFINRRSSVKTLVIVGSIRKVLDITEAFQWGAHIVTVPPAILREMTQHPKTTETVAEMRAALK